MKHVEVCQKYFAIRRIFNSFVSGSSGDETLHLMLDYILLQSYKVTLNTPWLVLKVWIYFALKSFDRCILCDFLGFPNSWLLITKGVKRFLTSTCLMDKSNKNNFSLHVFIKNKIYSSLEGRVYSQT